jgi:hypothetical protein
MKKNKRTIAFILALIFSIVFSLLFKWVQTGNPFKPETLMYGIIVFLNILITGGVAFSIFHKNANKSTIQVKKNILPTFFT